MNPLNKEWFYRGFRRVLRETVPTQAEEIWQEAGWEYARILSSRRGIRKENGTLVLPSVALYRTLTKHPSNTMQL